MYGSKSSFKLDRVITLAQLTRRKIEYFEEGEIGEGVCQH